jgi:hypothetical protein
MTAYGPSGQPPGPPHSFNKLVYRASLAEMEVATAPLLGIEPRYDLPPADRTLVASAKEPR